MREKQWKDLTDVQKRGIMFLGTIQLALLITALIDIRWRPADSIRGSKRLWTAVVFINGIGPIAYFLFGRFHKGARDRPKLYTPCLSW